MDQTSKLADHVPHIWPTSHFDALMFTIYGLAATTTALRVFVRKSIIRSIGMDDLLAVAATLVAAAFCAFEHEKIKYNNLYLKTVRVGRPLRSDPVETHLLTEADRMMLLHQFAYIVELALIKTSILAFYRRLAVSRKQKYILYAIGFCVVGFTIAFIVAACLGYKPTRALWYPYDFSTRRTNFIHPCDKLDVANTTIQAAIDVAILALPIPFLRTLNITRKKRIALTLLYMLGFFSFAATIIRLSQTVQYRAREDYLWRREQLMTYSIWTVVEGKTALICTNLPALYPLLKSAVKGYNSLKSRSTLFHHHTTTPSEAAIAQQQSKADRPITIGRHPRGQYSANATFLDTLTTTKSAADPEWGLESSSSMESIPGANKMVVG